jgi:nucleoside-diphosphate-sugar epimerase
MVQTACMAYSRVLILGCGYTGTAALRQAAARGLPVVATVRSEQRAQALASEPAQILRAPALDASIRQYVDAHTHVIVAFQPDPSSDELVSKSLGGAHSIAYISSTGVFGDVRGKVDDTTRPPEPPSERSARILRAEAKYREQGAAVLRASAIYGPDRGLHMRVIRGEHKLPGDGSRMVSRIHVEDLAAFALAAADNARAQTFVIGDEEPAPHIEVVRFICETYGCPLPPSQPLEEVHASLQADRAVDSARARTQLGVQLRYPSYRQGLARAATGL